jgi:hypothetical protein
MSKKPNSYLEKQRAMMQSAFEIGEEMGMQRMWDYLQVALRCPETMKGDTVGNTRMKRIYKKTVEVANEFQVAFTHDPEADYMQEKLDAALREIWKDELQPFYERYPYLKKIDYSKPIKGGSKG